MSDAELERAYADCLRLAGSHYENFPVASWLLPRGLRRPVAVIYAFARTADDLADEGDATPEARLAGLDAMSALLDAVAAGTPQDTALGRALADTVRVHALPLEPLRDLLSAFRQDVVKSRYADFGEVMDYCRRSANPVGRLLLHLLRDSDPRHLASSDAICSALQLINFHQDLHQDYIERGRIYLPQDEMMRFGVTEEHLCERRNDLALRRLMQLQYERARRLLRAGAPLARQLRGRFGFELRLTVLGADRVLERLMHGADAFARPRLDSADWARIVWRALRGR
ncbi:MAG: squalene synthase HpnC [Gammaproteobacteria bacterium]